MINDVLDTLGRIERQNNYQTATKGLDSASEPTKSLPEKAIALLNDDDVDVGARIYRELVEELWTPEYSPKREANKAVGDDAPRFQAAIARSLVSGVFDEIDNRKKLIVEAHQSTFSWIFDETPLIEAGKCLRSSFPKWLEGDDKSVFWITGKPGSGKSTLMKFILASDEPKKCLEKWAAGFPLQMTSFYAWIAGSDLQKSHLGFMRTVLYQCLQSHPEVASAVAPRRWALFSMLRSSEKQPPWPEWELKDSFHSLLLEIVKTTRVAFFIDGLDEFEAPPAQTLALVKDISLRHGIKVCVASRQWREFNDEFDKCPMLRMQDLTENDMMSFVRGTFSSNRGFHEQIQIFPDEVESIILEVVNKSNGVFLWSYLVVKNLSEAFTDGEGLFRLREILHGLPPDVKDLYTSIWRRMGHRSQDFAQLVALVKAKQGPLHFLNLWLADTGCSQGLTSLDLRDLSAVRVSSIRSQVIRRLDSHTRGILELSKDDNVELLHRTTLDWANREDIWSDISPHLDVHFDPFVELMYAEGLMSRRKLTSTRGGAPEMSHYISPVLYEVLRYAHKVRSSPRNTQRLVQILDDFNNDMIDTWENWGAITRHNDWAGYNGSGCDFLGLTARYCASAYVQDKLVARAELLEPTVWQGQSLLENVIFGHEYTTESSCVPFEARIRMVVDLFERGASPGQLRRKIRTDVRKRARQSALDTKKTIEDHKYWEAVDGLLSGRELPSPGDDQGSSATKQGKIRRGKFRLSALLERIIHP